MQCLIISLSLFLLVLDGFKYQQYLKPPKFISLTWALWTHTSTCLLNISTLTLQILIPLVADCIFWRWELQYLPSHTLFYNVMLTCPTEGRGPYPLPLKLDWSLWLCQARANGRNEAMRLPRLGHRTVMHFHLVFGRLTLGAQPPCCEEATSHMERVRCGSSGQQSQPRAQPIGSVNCCMGLTNLR